MSDHDTDSQAGSASAGNAPSRLRCALPRVRERVLAPQVTPRRARLIRASAKKWVNGTVLHYYFFDRDDDGEEIHHSDGTSKWQSYVGDERQRDAVRRGFEVWAQVGIGISFIEVDRREDAELRIGFMHGDGSWSYIGREVLDQAPSCDERTMNFGWDITSRSERDTVLHEIGHTLGFHHEHQNPNAGILWDHKAVYKTFSRPPNGWERDDIEYNILRKLPQGEVEGSNWDPNSIMHYPFDAGLIKEPPQYSKGLTPRGGLSERDKALVRKFYPPPPADTESEADATPTLVLLQTQMLDVGPGEQKNFWIEPSGTRQYQLQTFGTSDALMVLFEQDGAELRYLAADDDSGEERNARLEIKLVKGRRYLVRIRLYYCSSAGHAAVMLW